MAQQIEWTTQALQDYYDVLLYLEEAGSVEIADAFVVLTEQKLAVLLQQPQLGLKSEKEPEVRSILLTKHNRLYYKLSGSKLIVLNIFDTRRDQASNLF